MANVNYCIKKYKNEKGQSEIAGAIVQAIKQDFAGYDVSKKEAELDKLKREAQNNTDMTMRNLCAGIDDSAPEDKFSESDATPDETKQEVSKKRIDKSAQDAIEEAYNMFIQTGSFEDKDRLKVKTIEQMSDFQKSVICGVLKTDKKVAPEELSAVPLDLLLKSALFENTYRKTFIEELGF